MATFMKKVYDRLKAIASKSAKRKEALGVYRQNLEEYIKQNKDERFTYDPQYAYPCLYDRYDNNGNLNQYFWQDLWAAKQIAERNPKNHYDIGSRVDGFIAHLASFRTGIHLMIFGRWKM